jgi:hypothetical protein
MSRSYFSEDACVSVAVAKLHVWKLCGLHCVCVCAEPWLKRVQGRCCATTACMDVVVADLGVWHVQLRNCIHGSRTADTTSVDDALVRMLTGVLRPCVWMHEAISKLVAWMVSWGSWLHVVISGGVACSYLQSRH